MDKDGFEISFRLSPAKGVSDDDTNKESIKNEIISWMEDTFKNHKVEDLQVKERVGMFDTNRGPIFIGDSAEGYGDCPNCENGELEYLYLDHLEDTITCTEDCGLSIHSENRGWVITDITIEECEHTTTDMGGKCTHCLHQL